MTRPDMCEVIAEHIPLLVCMILIGICIGWAVAHSTIADECRRLGGFYVGKSTFKCVEEKNHD